VFHGTLDDGKMVAIKRASEQSLQGTTEFRNEVLLLSRLHHRHLVRLEGFCDDKGLQILVYEFMRKGNLHDHLLDSEKGKPLSWSTRLEIAVGVAQALDYLHSYADPPVIHRDIKPTNILLDDRFIAKVSDFGISKETPEFNTHVSTRPAGTAGYLDPEYFLRQQLTTASDVYAYGVVLLELITGQKAIDHMRFEEINLIGWVKPRFKEMGVAGIVDPAMGEDYDPEILKVMTEVALMSAASRKNDRPTMKEVLSLLEPHLKAFDPTSLSLQASRWSMKEEDSSKLYKPRHESSSDTGGSNSIEMSIPSSASTSHFNMTSSLLPR
jgi:serine/threonine protein kinase